MKKAKADHLFEVSWEVCNKVGGINTVLKSKAALMKERYRDYVCVGPWFEEKAKIDFEERETPEKLRNTFAVLQKKNITCRYGVWQAKGEPATILIDFSGLLPEKDRLKGELWQSHRVDSMHAGWDFEEPILFSAATALLLKELETALEGKTVAHCHEWMAGATILFLKLFESKIKTVFTTHATMLGRAICGSGEDLYEMLDAINPEEAAYRHGVAAKWGVERACAHAADVFTTVSQITGLEAEKLLGRKPDVLVLNGLDISRFPTIEETSIMHISGRERLREFLAYHFFPYYIFPLEHNLIFFITGRPEMKNKGVDVTVSALGKLNELLKQEADERTVTAFFWIPMGNNGVRMDVLENKNYYAHIKNYIETHSDEILKKVLHDMLQQKGPVCDTLFTKEFLNHVRKDLLHFKREGNPPLSTHHLNDDGGRQLLDMLNAAGLDNRKDDRVKVVVLPVYLDGNDGLFNLAYYDAIAGTHLGLFPSYYEPWGYTPLETAAMGVPALSTDLAGFGQFIKPHIQGKDPGIWVLGRQGKRYDEVAAEFAQILHDFTMLDHAHRVQNKLAAKELADLCDWEKFVDHYVEADDLALEK